MVDEVFLGKGTCAAGGNGAKWCGPVRRLPCIGREKICTFGDVPFSIKFYHALSVFVPLNFNLIFVQARVKEVMKTDIQKENHLNPLTTLYTTTSSKTFPLTAAMSADAKFEAISKRWKRPALQPDPFL